MWFFLKPICIAVIRTLAGAGIGGVFVASSLGVSPGTLSFEVGLCCFATSSPSLRVCAVSMAGVNVGASAPEFYHCVVGWQLWSLGRGSRRPRRDVVLGPVCVVGVAALGAVFVFLRVFFCCLGRRVIGSCGIQPRSLYGVVCISFWPVFFINWQILFFLLEKQSSRLALDLVCI